MSPFTNFFSIAQFLQPKILIYRIYILAGSSPVKASQASHVFLPLRTSTPSGRRSSRNRSFSWRGTVCGSASEVRRSQEEASPSLPLPPPAPRRGFRSPRLLSPSLPCSLLLLLFLLSALSPLPPLPHAVSL